MNLSAYQIKLSRRRALTLGAGVAGAMATGALAQTADSSQGAGPEPATPGNAQQMAAARRVPLRAFPSNLATQIEQVLETPGVLANGILNISVARPDITNIMLGDFPVNPAFQLGGSAFFQFLGHNNVLVNGNFTFQPEEVQPALDQFLAYDITLQALHQHFYQFNPQVWFIHFRASGDPLTIARGLRAVLGVTATPLPQESIPVPPGNLPAAQIASILGAQPASFSTDGGLGFSVPRAETILLGGYRANPYLNIATPISVQPYGEGNNVGMVADFGMLASEVDIVTRRMRGLGWQVGCLYNQETDENPQLYFSHMFKQGDVLQLAKEVRSGLDLTNAMYVS